jgi:hypothetical protein
MERVYKNLKISQIASFYVSKMNQEIADDEMQAELCKSLILIE